MTSTNLEWTNDRAAYIQGQVVLLATILHLISKAGASGMVMNPVPLHLEVTYLNIKPLTPAVTPGIRLISSIQSALLQQRQP